LSSGIKNDFQQGFENDVQKSRTDDKQGLEK